MGDILQELNGLIRSPPQRVKDLALIHHRFEPLALLGRSLNRQKQREQLLLVRSARILTEGAAKREVLRFCLRR